MKSIAAAISIYSIMRLIDILDRRIRENGNEYEETSKQKDK